jgi:predicted phage terminase large subunit-like protein
MKTRAELLELKKAALRERVIRPGGYYHFFKSFWSTVEGVEYIDEPYVKFLCDHVEALVRDELEGNRLLINIPPGHSKSMICVVMSLPWIWTLDPTAFIIYAHKDITLARDMARKTRQVVNSELYRELFPHISIKDDATKVDRFYNNQGGGRAAVTVRQQITGAHAKSLKVGGLIFVDDPDRPDDTEPDQMGTQEWYKSVLPTRFGSLKDSKICIIQQRVNMRDLSSYVLDTEEGYTHVCLPMHYDPERHCKTSVGEDWRTEEGELLSPLRNTPEVIERVKATMGDPRHALAQFEQKPSFDDGNIFRVEYFESRYDNLPEHAIHTLSCDLTFTGQKSSDYAVLQHWAESTKNGKHYLINQIREKMGFVDTAKRILDYLRIMGGTPNILIEKAANGYAVIEILSEAGVENIHEFSAGRNSKEQRASTVAYLFDRGDVLYPRQEPKWFEDYKKELLIFPAAPNDDQVDATTQYLAWATGDQSVDLAAALRFAQKLTL